MECDGKVYRCGRNHCFDRAKSGYVNLLTPNRMHSKLPGDNKLMVRARRAFLNRGYYSFLAEKLCSLVCDYAENNVLMLDAGCGEGYYTEKVAEALINSNKTVKAGGIDISKSAAELAAKSGISGTEYAAASIFHIPVGNESINILISAFSPLCIDEFYRILKADGLFFMVIPGRKHLWELKSALYDVPYENQVKEYDVDGFTLLKECDLPSEKIFLENREDISNLFTMTPYYYNTRAEDMAKLKAFDTLETTVEFKILVYRKKGEL